MQFTYGTNEVQPDTRHPAYSSDYTVNGGGTYRSISLMAYMQDKNDPRRRYYFYRQRGTTPGQDADPALETLQCSLQTPPAHYDGFPFCGLTNGYWGRDHGNDEGIPPDGFLRTLVAYILQVVHLMTQDSKPSVKEQVQVVMVLHQFYFILA